MKFKEILKMLPEGYKESCWETKAMRRKIGIQNEDLLMELCMYYGYNHSLMDVKNYAEVFHETKISDVGFMKRFVNCNEWFKKLLQQMIRETEVLKYEKPEILEKYRVMAIDATDVVNRGAVKQIWRLHYAVNLFTMNSEMFKITAEKTGEKLTHFEFKANDLVIADRIYGTIKGMEHCRNAGAEFILRLKNKAFTIYDKEGEVIKFNELLKQVDKDYNDFVVYYKNDKKELKQIRICIREKSEEDKKIAKKRIKRNESRKQKELSEETKFTHNYFFVVTSLDESFSCKQILDLYKLRWQVEMVFKRYKSILNLGSMPTKTAASSEAWLNCKMLIAMLIEKILATVDFSPYNTKAEEPMEGDEDIIRFDFSSIFRQPN